MRLSVISLLAAIVFLNTAPGHDCNGNPLPGYVEPDDTDTLCVDTVEAPTAPQPTADSLKTSFTSHKK